MIRSFHPRSTRAFELVEYMIVVVIIGLLAAMAIPAFQKVRAASIGKAMMNGARVSESDRQFYLKHRSENWPRADRRAAEREEPAARQDLKTLDANGVRYYLVPKGATLTPSEITMDGQTYYMVPISP